MHELKPKIAVLQRVTAARIFVILFMLLSVKSFVNRQHINVYAFFPFFAMSSMPVTSEKPITAKSRAQPQRYPPQRVA